ncbi:7905_t:CDS:10, partial [Cetraspora pellucida]
MEYIYIESDSDNINTDDYEPTINYESDDNYESFMESDKEVPIADLTESNSYSPFDDYEVIATQSSKVVNDNNINSNYDDDLLPINLITENLRVGEIRYLALPMEYLPTSEQGIAIVFNIGSWESYDSFFNNIQYQRGRPSGGGNTKVWYTFLDCDVHKYYSTCQGIKRCAFACTEIQNASHSEVNMDTDLYQEENMSLNDQKSKEIQTYTLLKVGLLDVVDGGIRMFEAASEITSCSVVLSSNSKRKTCGFLHRYSDNTVQEGSIIKHQCDVKYYKIIPYNIKECPYVILISKGIHKHSPPPSTKVPNEITNKLKDIIKEASEELVNITPRKLVSSNLIKATFGVNYLSQIHASLNNINKLRRLVSKVQKIHHPFGQGLLGLTYNIWKKNIKYSDYVQQSAVFSNGQLMIICISELQAKAWIDLEYFEIDLSFKRVSGKINEFEINCYNEKYKLTLTYARVFTNIANSEAYYRMFNSLFDWVFKLTEKLPQFYHIHKMGWKCIIGVLDNSQAKGLDEALHSIDKSLSWDEHLCYIFKSYQLMYELLEASTYERIDKIFKELKASNELNINASLNPLFSFMDTEIWLKAPDNTNVAEASHANINRDGKALSLENAILKAKHYDECYFNICNIQDKYRIIRNFQKTKRQINKPTKVSKKPKVDTSLIQDTKNNLELQEKQLLIKERKLKLEERKVRLEHEKLE